MIDIDKTILIQLVNFIITIIALNFLLIDPIRQIIKKRQGLMAEKLGKIEQFATQSEAKVRDYEAVLAEARKQGVETRNAMKGEGGKEEQAIMASAGQEAASILKTARADIASQSEGALGQLRKEVEKYAAKATEKLLGRA